jgi:hypothetical protein
MQKTKSVNLLWWLILAVAFGTGAASVGATAGLQNFFVAMTLFFFAIFALSVALYVILKSGEHTK